MVKHGDKRLNDYHYAAYISAILEFEWYKDDSEREAYEEMLRRISRDEPKNYKSSIVCTYSGMTWDLPIP